MHRPQGSFDKLLAFAQHTQFSFQSENPPSKVSSPRPRIRSATRITSQLEAIIKAAHDARDACAAKGYVGRQEESQVMNEAWTAAHAEQTRAWADDAFSRIRDAMAKADSAASGQPLRGKKPVFHHEYTPLLEKYFEYNAYPSALDRSILARKSMMTPRQIEVWFQNHRNRARKDGKPIRKLTEDPLPLEISLDSLERKMPFFTIPEHERKPLIKPESPNDDSDDEDISSPSRPLDPTSATALSPLRPPHAFPTLYPAGCDYDPFPNKTGAYRFPPPVWFRKPATSQRTSKIAINMEAFIADFDTKLHIRAPISKTRRSKVAQSWCASRATILPPAPHPALVRSSISSPLVHMPCLPVFPAPPLRSHPFQSPNLFVRPMTRLSAQHPNDSPIRRKVARLPKRTPKSTSIPHRHRSPGISEASPVSSRSSSTTSFRARSFSSEMSTDRRPSSSSSISSSSSSTLATPELPHTALPDDGPSPPVSVSGVDFNNMDDLFGNSRQSPSPEMAMPFSFSVAAQPKDPFPFGFQVPRVHSENSPFRSCSPVS